MPIDIVVSIAAAFVAGGLVAAFNWVANRRKTNAEIEKLEQEIKESEAATARQISEAWKGLIEPLEKRIQQLEVEIKELESEKGQLRERVRCLEKENEELKRKVRVLENGNK